MRISVYRKGVRPWPEVEIYQATNEDLLSFIRTESASHDISDDLDDAVWDEALRRMTGSASQLAELLEKLQDPEIVHSYILRGRIQLTRAQAIHIAGLPGNIDFQVAQLQAQLTACRIAARNYAEGVEAGEKIASMSYAKGEKIGSCDELKEVLRCRRSLDSAISALAASQQRVSELEGMCNGREMKPESAQQQIAALEARNRELREKVRACIDMHQDIFSWQKGESRNGLVAEIRDKVDAIFAALKA